MAQLLAEAPRARWQANDLDLLAGGSILEAFHAAERLRGTAPAEPAVAGALLGLLADGDELAAMLSVRALSACRGLAIDHSLTAALDEPLLAEQAAWALGVRSPVTSAVPRLARLVALGGFPAMPAQLALERWGGGAGARVRLEIRRALARATSESGWARLAETLSLSGRRSESRRRRPAQTGRLRVAQILLRGSVDADLACGGRSDGGGVVTLIVQLAAELGRRADVERSLIVARPRPGAASAELLGPAAALVRLPFGPSEDVPVEDMWEHRAQIERAVAELLRRQPLDVAHLRYADAGTFAAARALRQAGVRIAFTLAPDPHAPIDDLEASGALDRAAFAAREASEHNLFRLRLVDDLVTRADHLVTLPRAGGQERLEALLGRALPRERTRTVAEGIAVRPLDSAREAVTQGREGRAARDLRAALGGRAPGRLDLPLLVSAGRLHPVKGFPRLVEAWAGDPDLAARFNLVVVGGALDRPTAVERAVLDGIEAALAVHPAARDGVVLLGARPHGEVAELLALARHGLPGTASPGGAYVCASDKEEFGVAVLEAMASGLAVVAPAGGGPATYVQHGVTGVLVEPRSVAALRRGLREVAGLTDDEGRAAVAESTVREHYSIARMAAALTATYAQARAA